jgi:autotransporter-associated beta strand protein
VFTGNQGTILPFAEVNGGGNTGDFTTYGANGIVPFSNYLVQNLGSATSATLNGNSGDIVKVIAGGSATGTITITGTFLQTIGALLFVNANSSATATTVQLNPNGLLTVNSGAIMTVGGTSAANAVTLGTGTGGSYFLPTESVLFQNNSGSGNTVFNGPIIGSGSLVIAGGNTVSLSSTNNNTFSGGTVVNAGLLIVNAASNFGNGTLTLTGGTIQSGSALTFSNPFNLNGNISFTSSSPIFTAAGTLTTNAVLNPTASVTFNGSIGETVGVPRTLTVASGGGSAIVNNINTWTGGTILVASTLQVGNAGALSTGAITFAGGALNSNISVVVGNSINLPNVTATLSSVSSGNNLTFTGPVSLTGSNTLAVSNTGLTAFTGVVSGSGALLLNTGGGTVQFTGANTYSGGLTVSAGTLLVSNAQGLSSGPLSPGGGTVIATTPVAITNPLLLSGTVTTSGSNPITFSGTTTLLGNGAVTANDISGTTLAGNILESGGTRTLTAQGTATLTLTNPNVFSGGVTLNTGTATGLGTLTPASSAVLGTGALTLTAGALQAAAPLTLTNPVTINNTGVTPVAFAGSPITVTGAVSVTGGPTLLLMANTTTLGGGVAGNVALTLSNAPVPAGSATLSSTGTLLLTSADSSTSTVTINGGTLTLGGAAGALSAITGITVNTGGTFTLDNTTANNTTRVNAASPVNLTGGTFNFLGSSTAASSQTFAAALNLNSGNSTISTTSGSGQNAVLTFNSLSRSAGASVNFVAGAGQTLGSGSNQIKFVNTPGGFTNSVIKGATTTDAANGGFNLASFAAANGVFALASYQSLSTSGGNSNTDNVLVTSSTGPIISESVNAVLIRGDGIVVSGAAGAALTVGTGMIASSGGTGTGNIFSVPTVTLSTQEGVFLTGSGTTTISSAITGSAGLTVGGAGTLALNGTSTYAGTTTLNSGALSVGSFGALSTSTLQLTGGTIQAGGGFPANSPLTLTNAVTFNNSVVTLGGGIIPVAASGASESGNTVTITTTTAHGFAPGQAVRVTGVGVAGYNGTFIIASTPNSTTFTYLNPTSSLAGSGGGTATVAGPIVLSGTVTLNGTNNLLSVAGAAGQATCSGQVVGAGNLTKMGAGTLFLTNALGAASTFSGQTTIVSGVVNAQNANSATATPLGATSVVVVANGGTLQFQGLPAVSNGAALTAAPGIAISRPLVLNGNGATGTGALESVLGLNTVTSTITLNTAATIGVDAGTVTASGVISGPGDLTKLAGGTLTLTATNTYLGQTNINNGVLQASTASAALGAIIGTVVVNSGATLQTTTGTTFGAKTLILNGTGFAGANLAGAFVAAANATTWQGNIVLNAGATIGVNSGITLNLPGIVSGNADLTKVGPGIMNLLSANTYSGNTVIHGGTLNLVVAGTALGSSGFIVNPGATLALDNNGSNAGTTSVNLSSRTSVGANITLNAGSLNFVANAGTGSTPLSTNMRIGTIVLGPGQSTVQAGYTSQPTPGSVSVLTVTSLVRTTGGTVNFIGNPGGTASAGLDTGFNRLVFVNAPTTVGNSGGVLPYATVGGADFATYDIVN